MDRSLYTAMSGARQTMLAQAVHANNLANASTTGFRADTAQTRAMPLFGEVYASRVFAMTEKSGSDFSEGAMDVTGRELDFAIQGEGFIAVQGADGKEAYTRAGDLKITPNGLLQTGAGFSVMGNAGPIAIPPAEKIEIGSDGTISVRAVGQGPESLSEVNRIKLVNPDIKNIDKGLDGLFHTKDGIPPKIDSSISIASGYLEGSNVNVVDSLTEILNLSRRFEMQVRMMKDAEENDQAAARILQQSA